VLESRLRVASYVLQVTSLYILDFRLWIWDLNQFQNPQSEFQNQKCADSGSCLRSSLFPGFSLWFFFDNTALGKRIEND